MEVFSTQLLNYHLERREEVIKINLGRRSPEKSGGEVDLMNFFKTQKKVKVDPFCQTLMHTSQD